MNIQSSINAVRARINQIKTSDLFNKEDRKKLLQINNAELEALKKLQQKELN